jgi:hypothetical protein
MSTPRRVGGPTWWWWNCAQRGQPLDRADRHIAEVMRGIRRRHGRSPDQKEAVLAEEPLVLFLN